MTSILQFLFFITSQVWTMTSLYQTQQTEIASLFFICNLLLIGFSILIHKIKNSKLHNFHELWARIMTFWWILSTLGISLVLPTSALVIVFCFTSAIALAEFIGLSTQLKTIHELSRNPYFIILFSMICFSYFVISNQSLSSYLFFQIFVLGIITPCIAVFCFHESSRLYVINTGYLFFVVLLSLGFLLAQHNIQVFLLTVFLTEIRDLVSYWLGKSLNKLTIQSKLIHRIINSKIAEQVSPNKTWFTGILSLFIIYLLTHLFIEYIFIQIQWTMLQKMIFSLTIGIFGLFGDLVFSLIKRIHNEKDSGTWLPGGSGIIDRIDSLIFTLPMIYFIFYFN